MLPTGFIQGHYRVMANQLHLELEVLRCEGVYSPPNKAVMRSSPSLSPRDKPGGQSPEAECPLLALRMRQGVGGPRLSAGTDSELSARSRLREPHYTEGEGCDLVMAGDLQVMGELPHRGQGRDDAAGGHRRGRWAPWNIAWCLAAPPLLHPPHRCLLRPLEHLR